MTAIRVSIDRLILHGPPQGLSPEISRDLGLLVAARLEELVAGPDRGESRAHLSESHRIADQVAGEVWRAVEEQRAGSR